MGRLDGKVAFITGAAGGIGRATCTRYIQEGGRIAAVDLDKNVLAGVLDEVQAGDQGIAVACDITGPCRKPVAFTPR